MNNNIENARKKIDLIDHEIMLLLKQRFDLCREIGKQKQQQKMAITQQSREDEVITNYIGHAKKLKLNLDFCKKLIHLILQESRDIQSQ
ncbi:MAG: chorismate mutase [Gammaproteobacteria bacterium]|nr:chorismate mutase [Gammaproteobacteria bacterium]